MLERPVAPQPGSATLVIVVVIVIGGGGVEAVRAEKPTPETGLPSAVHRKTVPRQHRSVLVSTGVDEALETNQNSSDRLGPRQRDSLGGRDYLEPERVRADCQCVDESQEFSSVIE